MEYSNINFSYIHAKPPLSTRGSKTSLSSHRNLSSRNKTTSFGSSPLESRTISISPSRGMVPLNLVSSSNVNIPLNLQKKLAGTSENRKALAGVLRLNNENLNSSTAKASLSNKSSNVSLKLSESKEKTQLKECTFGPIGKENNYVNIYNKNKIIKQQLRKKEGVQDLLSRMKTFDLTEEVAEQNLQEMDSEEVEKRYQKITEELDKISKNIQIALYGSR